VDLNGQRGKIRDRDGNILALDLVKKELCADPAMILSNRQAQVVSTVLGQILQVAPDSLLNRLRLPANRFVYLNGYGRYLDDAQADEIKRMKLTGIWLNDAMVRTYPRLNSACHVLGYVNLQRAGSAGIEQRWDRYLRDIPGLLISELDGRRNELYDRRMLEIKPCRGADVTLTLDQYVQYITENALEKAVREHQAAGGWVIVESVRTGEILAMANWPAYDANQFRQTSPEVMRNRCIADVYEPGSTFKIAVVSAALNEGVVTSSQIIDCEGGTWFYRGRPLRSYHPAGLLTVADVIKESDNIGAAKIALMLGDARLHRYLKSFGVGARTGIDLPGEEAGILHPLHKWLPISATRIAIGHEVSVTALQMLGILCAIANDGVLMKPYIVRQVAGPDGRILFEQQPTVVSRPIRPETAAEMRRLLVRVTEKGGTGVKARVEGYTVGGKTGTAQKPVPGGYSDILNMASFAGFIPAEDPQLAIIVVLDEPKANNVRTGGAVAAPAFREIAEQAIRYLDIPPGGNNIIASQASGAGSRGL
jgi:cell division protein FtsI (penicillin-binding protein 3)